MGTHLTLEIGDIIRLNYQFMRDNCLTVPSRTHRTEDQGGHLGRTISSLLMNCNQHYPPEGYTFKESMITMT